jgi:hypothetical protein
LVRIASQRKAGSNGLVLGPHQTQEGQVINLETRSLLLRERFLQYGQSTSGSVRQIHQKENSEVFKHGALGRSLKDFEGFVKLPALEQDQAMEVADERILHLLGREAKLLTGI